MILINLNQLDLEIFVLQEILVVEHFQLKKMAIKYNNKISQFNLIEKKTLFCLVKVAEIHKKFFHIHDTYSVKLEGNQDPAIILLITIGIDEIRKH